MLRCPDFSQDLKASLFEIRLVAVNRTVSCLYWFSLNTPKALANSAQRLERQRQPWVMNSKTRKTLKGFGGWRTPSELERR